MGLFNRDNARLKQINTNKNHNKKGSQGNKRANRQQFIKLDYTVSVLVSSKPPLRGNHNDTSHSTVKHKIKINQREKEHIQQKSLKASRCIVKQPASNINNTKLR